jgi:hypothetical protein
MSDVFPSFLGITPFGPYCRVCNVPLASTTGILPHGKEFHPECKFKNATVLRQVQRQVASLRSLHANDLTPFLTEQHVKEPTWFCTLCFQSFRRAFNYERHSERNTCTSGFGGKMECYVTICGRVGPKTSNNRAATPLSTLTIVSEGTAISTLTDNPTQSSSSQSSVLVVDPRSKVPATLLSTQSEASAILKPFVRPDEDVEVLCMIY